MNLRYAPLPTRFEQKIKKGAANECWLWTSASDGRYGFFWFNGGNVSAHRFSYELYIGLIPDGMCVCHSCDNGLCVNPSHLFLGTPMDNVHDKIRKGRAAPQYGEYNPRARFTKEQIKQVFELRKSGLLQREIAANFGVSRGAISKILLGKRWCVGGGG